MASSRINYDIRTVKESDYKEIIDHFRKNFFKDAPLLNYFRIVTDENPISEDFEAALMKSLKNSSQNLVAVHDGKIIGASVNEVMDKDDRRSLHKVELKNERVKVIREFAEFCISEAKLFEKNPDCQKAFSVNFLSVDGAYRGCGVAKALVNKSMELAKQFGCGVVTANCASLYSAQLFENLGYKAIFEQPYKDYVVKGDYKVGEEFRQNGRIVLRPKEPHRAMKVYAKRVI